MGRPELRVRLGASATSLIAVAGERQASVARHAAALEQRWTADIAAAEGGFEALIRIWVEGRSWPPRFTIRRGIAIRGATAPESHAGSRGRLDERAEVCF